MCRATGDYQSALSYYKIAIDKGTGKVVTNGMGQFYSNAGQIYYLLGKYKQAREYLEKAVACFERHGYYWGLERAEAYMALVLLEMNEREEAKKHYEKSMQLSDKMNNPTTVGVLREVKSRAGF